MPEVKWEHQLPDNRLETIQYITNHVGVFSLDPVRRLYHEKDTPYRSVSSGICHKPFHEIIDNAKYNIFGYKENAEVPFYMWWAIPHYKNMLSPLEQNEWIEFSLSPETSPWRMMLDKFDYSITRNEDGLITGLIMPVPHINTVALFHLFKGIRGAVERRTLPFLHAKKIGVTDQQLLHKLYVLSSYFVSLPEDLGRCIFSIGGEHQPFKLKLNENVLNSNMICNLNHHSLLKSTYYYGQCNMGTHVFGQRTMGEGIHNKMDKFILENLVKNGKEKVNEGYFLKIIEPLYNTPRYYVDLDLFIENVDKIWEILS